MKSCGTWMFSCGTHAGSSSPTRDREHGPPALTALSLTHWTTWEVPRHFFFFFLKKIYWLIDCLIDWLLCWVFVSVRGLSPVVASGGHSSSRCAGFSLSWPLLLRSTGSRRAGSVIVAHGPTCSAACGIFPDQGSNPCPLNWQADSQPLRHQGSPLDTFEDIIFLKFSYQWLLKS